MKRIYGVLVAAAAIVIAGSTTEDRALRTAGIPDPVTDADYYEAGHASAAKVELGRLLFFDKILSGNKNISCATCHHPAQATSDGLALGIGEGASGLGPDRRPGDTESTAVHARIPRNSPALFNVGAAEFTRMFHDGRVETDPNEYFEGGFVTPARWKLKTGLENVLAAQAMFPVTSQHEMAGQKGENSISEAVTLANVAGKGGVWEQLGGRLQASSGYVERFQAAFPDQVLEAGDITYVLAANAIAAFETEAFRSDDSPYDEFLRGESNSLSSEAKRGMDLFYGKAQCSSCHSGKFQTDHDFHAIAMPQIGPGKADGNSANYRTGSGEHAVLEDFGRGRETVRPEDNFKFRTPSLRNVELTGPWGHSGAYADLEAVVRHHLDPVASLERYELDDGLLPELGNLLELVGVGSKFSHEWLTGDRLQGFMMRDSWVQSHDELRGRIAAANELEPMDLSDAEVADLMEFLGSLTGESARDLMHVVPEAVPSGLPVAD
ncbi:MAG: cytochrome c peroxidase [Gemmatimonadota bacterium]